MNCTGADNEKVTKLAHRNRKITQKHASSITDKNVKLQLSHGLAASYVMRSGNGVGLFWDRYTHTHTHAHLLSYLLTYLLRTHTR